MSTVAHASVTSKSADLDEQLIAFEEKIREEHPDWDDDKIVEAVVAYEQNLLNPAPGTPIESSDNALPEATEAERNAIEDYKAEEAEVVSLAVATLDPKDMLKKYAKLGRAVLNLAAKRKRSFKGWVREDFDKVCDDLAVLVKMRVPIKDVRMSLFARIYLWVEAVKPLVPNVEKLSYFQVANKFVPTLSFDAVELTGEIKKEWLTWVRTTVERQIGDDPMSMKELDASIEERKKEIERERAAKKDPEKALQAELRAAEKKAKTERQASQNKVFKALDSAISEGHADVNDVVQIVEKALSENKLALPRKFSGFDHENCTIEDCVMLAKGMFAAGKLVEMKALRDNLDAMIKIAEHALLKSKTA
jgi:hypothetical protein